MEKKENYALAVKTIKTAILQGQYAAAKGTNRIQLATYFAIGEYISQNSRHGFWGKGAIETISEQLRRELLGLRGFSATNMKNMRKFYESWIVLDSNSTVVTAELYNSMNRFSACLIVSFLLASCVENTVESQLVEGADDSRVLRSLLTKSVGSHQEDSLTMLSKLQSDVDYLMMGRVIQKDSLFVLAIKKEDALFLGVTEDVYDKYLDYVVRLNEQLSENRRN